MPNSFIKNVLSSKGRLRAALTFFLVIIFFLIFNQFSFFKPVSLGLRQTIFRTGDIFENITNRLFTSSDSLTKRTEDAEAFARTQSLDISRISQLEKDVAELESLLSYSKTQTIQTYPASILARSITKEHSLIIDKGSDDGLRKGLAVVVEDGHLIGVLSNVNRYTSEVTLVSNTSSKIPVSVLNDNKTEGLVEGRGGFLLEMGFIPKDVLISAQDLVVTSGLSGAIPPGLIIGVVSEVIRVDTDLFVQAFVRPLIDVSDYSRVLILDPLANTQYDS